MPFEIPGDPIGILPDKKSSGRCPNCRRSYRRLKILKTEKQKTLLVCPHCGKVVKEESSDQ